MALARTWHGAQGAILLYLVSLRGQETVLAAVGERPGMVASSQIAWAPSGVQLDCYRHSSRL